MEGYGGRRYKMDFVRFLTMALASNDETLDHLETLFDTGLLKNKSLFESIHSRVEELGKKLNNFLQAVERQHKT